MPSDPPRYLSDKTVERIGAFVLAAIVLGALVLVAWVDV